MGKLAMLTPQTKLAWMIANGHQVGAADVLSAIPGPIGYLGTILSLIGPYYAYHCSWFTTFFFQCREWRSHPARIPPDDRKYAKWYWRKTRLGAGRYIGISYMFGVD